MEPSWLLMAVIGWPQIASYENTEGKRGTREKGNWNRETGKDNFPPAFPITSFSPYPSLVRRSGTTRFGRQVFILFFTWGFYPNTLSGTTIPLASLG